MGVQLTRKLEALRETVRVMRDIGVVQWDGILLGPEPKKPVKVKKGEEDDQADRRKYYEELIGRSVSDGELRRLP